MQRDYKTIIIYCYANAGLLAGLKTGKEVVVFFEKVKLEFDKKN